MMKLEFDKHVVCEGSCKECARCLGLYLCDAVVAVRAFSVSCRSAIHTHIPRDVLGGGISKKLGTYIHHVSGRCWKGFQNQRSKFKTRNTLYGKGIHCGGVASKHFVQNAIVAIKYSGHHMITWW